MALSREELDNFADPTRRVYSEMQVKLLRNIAARLAQRPDLMETDVEEWGDQALAEVEQLTDANSRAVRELAESGFQAIDGALEKAGYGGTEEIEELLKQALDDGRDLLEAVPLDESEQIVEILEQYKRQARDALNLANATMIDEAEEAYRQIINRAVADQLTGVKSAQQSVRDSCRSWAQRGIPAMRDAAGREWSAEGYVRMVSRTTANNVTNDMQEQRFDDYGVDLVEVSSHAGARPGCEPYQGRIYSRSGESQNYPPLSETSKGEPDGLFGINCHHTMYPYFHGTEKRYKPRDKRENQRAYENSQKQRRHEREVRQAKTELETMKSLGDEDVIKAAKARVRDRQAKVRKFTRDTGRTRRYDREGIFR